MSEEKRKVKSRKRHSSKLMRWLHTEGRRYCAIALCASLILGNIGQMAAAADGDPDKEFELDRVALYEAVQEAVLGDPVAEGAFEFSGDAASTYEKYMFEDDVSLYELKPEINDNKGDLKLRIFAKLDGEVALDDDVSVESETTQLYEIDGTEEFYFLLTNTSSREQTAVIRVGEKETELITVVPNSAVVRTEPEGQVAAENLVITTSLEEVGPGVTGETAATQNGSNVVVSGSTSNGDSIGGGGGNGSGGGTTISKTENETVQETTEAVPEIAQPTETEAEKETQIAEESETAEETAAVEKSKEADETDASETEEVKENGSSFETGAAQESEAVSGTESSKENSMTQESGGADAAGADQGDTNENKAESSENASSENTSGSTSEESDTNDTSTGTDSVEVSIENGDSSGNVVGNETEVSVIGDVAEISFHKIYRVAESKATASNATPSDAEEEELATDSNAAKNALDGSVWEAASLDDAGVVVFATTAENIQVSSDLEKFASPSDAGHLYQASVDDLGITVQVYAKENSFSEKVNLMVKELREDDDETSENFQKAKDALNDSGLEYTDMIALDVSFISRTTGEEVEPENGNVQVYFELDASLVAEDAIETLAVHHLEEQDGDIVHVETVADNANEELADLLVDDNGELITTEFAIDSFSTIVFTNLKPTYNAAKKVDFYVNLNSNMANSNAAGEDVKNNFTPSLCTATFEQYPLAFDADDTTEEGWYIVISGIADGSSYETDKKIRTLETGYSEASLENNAPFKLSSFPTDTDVLNKIKNYLSSSEKEISVAGTTISAKANNLNLLTIDNYAIRWYVFKYSTYDSWHIDGILVPKYGRLSVSKTIKNAVEVLKSVEDSFAINVNSSSDDSASEQSYKLILNSEASTNQGIRLYDSKAVSEDGNSVTYKWEIDVLDREYTISESGADVKNWTYSATYSTEVNDASGDKSVTNEPLNNNSFTIKCVVVADDTGEDKNQSVHLTNTYAKASGDLKITKAVSGADVADKVFAFTVKADKNTRALVDGTEYMVGDTAYTVSNNTLKVRITGAESITIKDLPLGIYTVSEVVDGTELDLKEYYYAENDGEKTVKVTGNATAEATITNTYEPWLKITVRKNVIGNMGDRSAEFKFKPNITRNGKNITSDICSNLMSNDQFILKHCDTSESKYKEYIITGLKRGDMVTVEEVGAEAGYTTTAEIVGDVTGTFENKKYSTGVGGIQKDTDVSFINEKNVNIPTGLFTTKIPYMLMLAVAVLGILGFTVTDFKKHTLKKREDD